MPTSLPVEYGQGVNMIVKCPGCGNEDEEEFIKIDGDFSIETGDYHKYKEEVSLWGCTKCSCVIVNHMYKFNHKETTKEAEARKEAEKL